MIDPDDLEFARNAAFQAAVSNDWTVDAGGFTADAAYFASCVPTEGLRVINAAHIAARASGNSAQENRWQLWQILELS